MNTRLFVLLACTFTCMQNKAITLSSKDQEKMMNELKNRMESLQIDVQKMHKKIENSFKTKKINISKREIIETLKAIEQTINQISDFARTIEKSPIKNNNAITQLHQLTKDVFTLQKETSVMTHLEESFELLMTPF